MRILAIDTATESCSAALLIDQHLLQRGQLLERGAAEAILMAVRVTGRNAAVVARSADWLSARDCVIPVLK